MIDPRCLYLTEDCLSDCGIGEELLHRMRAAGLVVPIEFGRRLYYPGDQLKRGVLLMGRERQTGSNRRSLPAVRDLSEDSPPYTEDGAAAARRAMDGTPDRAASARRPIRGNRKGFANARSHSKVG